MKRLAAMQAPIDPTALDDCSRPRQVERFRAWFALELETSA